MTNPGWYHAQGDPEGTQRYWDGAQWQGDAVVPETTTNDIVYYAPAEDQVDLGDVATRISLAETDPSRIYAESPYSVASSSVNVTKRKPLPEGLKNLAVLTSVLKAIPLFSIAASLLASFGRSSLRAGRFDPPGLNYGTAMATVILLAVFVLLASLLVTQVRTAVRDHASNLFAVAFILLILDLLSTVGQWAAADDFSIGVSLFATVVLTLQAAVTLWAAIAARP